MKVLGVIPRGYCKGVIRAINIAKKSATHHKPISILGMIVHNQYIVNALEELGIHTIDQKGKSRLELLDEIDEDQLHLGFLQARINEMSQMGGEGSPNSEDDEGNLDNGNSDDDDFEDVE